MRTFLVFWAYCIIDRFYWAFPYRIQVWICNVAQKMSDESWERSVTELKAKGYAVVKAPDEIIPYIPLMGDVPDNLPAVDCSPPTFTV